MERAFARNLLRWIPDQRSALPHLSGMRSKRSVVTKRKLQLGCASETRVEDGVCDYNFVPLSLIPGGLRQSRMARPGIQRNKSARRARRAPYRTLTPASVSCAYSA